MAFSYLLDKIRSAEFSADPFLHIQINDFFSPEDFAALAATPEIATVNLKSDEDLFDTLIATGYKIIDFPGCILDKGKYISWHKHRKTVSITNSACEGFGVTLRLIKTHSAAVSELNDFVNSPLFQKTLAEKYGISMDDVFYDAGIQKYLDGYEISPHPDIRRKALTYMVNLNPASDSEAQDHHTHYLKFQPNYSYVQSFWEGHPGLDRCWVPWSWCKTETMQRANNSIVIFSPSNSTMHGVKTNYDHLKSQRTQLYGNLWYHDAPAKAGPEWEDFVIKPRVKLEALTLKGRLKSAMPKPVKDFIVSRRADKDVIANRLGEN